MSLFENSRKQMNDLMSQRAAHLKAAEAAKNASNMTEYQTYMNKAKELNPKIDDLKAEVDEADRYANLHAPSFGQARQDVEEMGRALMAHERVKVDVSQAIRGLRQNSTLYSGTLVQPTGAGSNIHDGFSGQASSLIDQVQSVSLTGLSGWEEPYVVSELNAQGGKVTTVAGTARAASDPTFAKAKITPYETSVTAFVDRNIARLSPADYAEKIQGMALRALRRKINGFIVNGDGQSSPDMFGILNAKNTAGANIFHTLTPVSAIDVNTLDSLVFGYGGDEEMGGNARLLLSKANLQAFGKLRGTNEKNRLFNITPDAANPNTGTISDGGMIVPYTIVSSLGDTTLAYGDPYNYLLGLFGDYVIRVDESVKAVERMNAILGDILIGGNLVVDKGFVVATVGTAAASEE